VKVVTAEQIRELDRRAIQEAGIPGVVLMENAGRAVVEVMEREYGALRGKRIAVFCGPGNNGGDGFVIARLLALREAKPICYPFGDRSKAGTDTQTHREVLAACGVELVPFTDCERERKNWRDELIVDALLGTGIRSAPHPDMAEAIQCINASRLPVIAVDIPSGVDADTGATPGAAVRATHTVTFAYPKIGLFLFPGAECVGTLHVADIGFHWAALESPTLYRWLVPGEATRKFFVSPSLLGEENWTHGLKKRKPESNKGDYGHVGIFAGSRGMAGAPAMVARAAQRVGAGLVTVLAPESVQPTIGAKLDEQMTIPLPETDGAANEAAFETLAHFAQKATVFCIGPGLTTEPGTVALVHRLLTKLQKPIVLDADGLNALAQNPGILAGRPEDPRAPLILTPHPGEAARLLGTSIADVQSNRIASVCELARRYRAIAILKGRFTLIADPEGHVCINTSGNPGMATGGMGDTLTGILGGLLAQTLAPGRDAPDENAFRNATGPPEEIAALGVHLHGLAGDLAAAQHGETGLVTSDLIACLPAAIRLLEGER